MARTQTLVQLSDELRTHLDAYRERTGQSRSAVIRDAIEAFLAADREREIDRQIVEGYAKFPETEEELRWARASGRDMVEEEPW